MENFIPKPDCVDGWPELPEEIRDFVGCPDFARNIDPQTHGYPSYMPRALERVQLASGLDLQRDPELPTKCTPLFPVADQGKRYGSYFADFHLVNYSLEVSNRYHAQRFMRMALAQKIVQNYDYTGHLNHQPLSGFTDLDDLANQWIAKTLTPTPKRYG